MVCSQSVVGEFSVPHQEHAEYDAETLGGLAQHLMAAIPKDRQGEWGGKVMAYLARETLRRICAKESDLRVATKVIHTDLGANPGQKPSSWLSPLWGQIEDRYYPEIEAQLIERCRADGLSCYPVLEKSTGRPAYYWIGQRPIPPAVPADDIAGARGEVSLTGVRYTPDLTLQLSRRGRFLFENGMVWSRSKRLILLAWALLVLMALGAFILLGGIAVGANRQALSGQDLIMLAVVAAVGWFGCGYLLNIFRLFDDRIIIAPDWMLAWKETGATIDITRSPDSSAPSTIHVRRYSALCPVCGRMVKLDRGRSDFPGRIVGRCEESPLEHVFAFDRVTRSGEALRVPPLRLESSVLSGEMSV